VTARAHLLFDGQNEVSKRTRSMGEGEIKSSPTKNENRVAVFRTSGWQTCTAAGRKSDELSTTVDFFFYFGKHRVIFGGTPTKTFCSVIVKTGTAGVVVVIRTGVFRAPG